MKKIYKRGFTIVEVSILFVIFLIVALLVAPLSLDDSMQAKNASKWKNVQSDFENIFYSVDLQKQQNNENMKNSFESVIAEEIKEDIEPYRIVLMNGTTPNVKYKFEDFKVTHTNATISYKWLDNPQGGIIGMILYDVNGQVGPNTWGKDVFGLNIYEDRFEPFCKNDAISIQKRECRKQGSGLCCANYYLIGGSLN